MRKLTLLAAGLLIAAIPAIAEVKDSGANGFTITTTFTVKESPAVVYQKIVAIGEWWNPEHTYSGDARNMTIDARASGCWCEKLPKSGGSVAHMQVATAWPGTMLVMTGGLGPLQSMGSSGSMTFKLAAVEGGTRVDFTYAVTGYHPQGMATLAPLVDGVLMDSMARLRNYVDTGSPTPAKK